MPGSADKDTFFTIPFGLGVRLDISQHATIGAEFGWRPTFSDYLDNVRNIHGKSNNDWYSFHGINVSILFGQWFFD